MTSCSSLYAYFLESPSRKALVKDLKPKNRGRGTGKYEVARAVSQHSKLQPRQLQPRQPQLRRPHRHDQSASKGKFHRSGDVPVSAGRSDDDKHRGRIHKTVIEPYRLPNSLRLSGKDTSASLRSRESDDHDSSESSFKKPKIINPLSEEFDMFSRSEPVNDLPSEFTSPPLLEGLLTSLTQVLGPHAKPTPIQALSLKHLFASDSSSASPTSSLQWKQYLLASETGSGKSIAYLLPILQYLKLAELRRSQSPPEAAQTQLVEKEQPRRALNPRALILAPTHELSRQLSGFAKALLHVIKLRVLCASQANAPSRSRLSGRRLTASKMSEFYDRDDLLESQAISAEFAMRKKAVSRPVDLLVGTPSKILEMVRGRGWDWEKRNAEGEGGVQPRKRKIYVDEAEMGLADVEWVIVDEADVLFGTPSHLFNVLVTQNFLLTCLDVQTLTFRRPHGCCWLILVQLAVIQCLSSSTLCSRTRT